MKLRGWALGAILFLSFSLISVSTQNQTVATPGQEIKDLMAVIGKVPTTIKKEALASLADQIKNDNAALSAFFKEKNFKAMATLYDERHGVLSKQNYQIIYGKDSGEFWSRVWSPEAALEFKLVSVYVSGLPALRKEAAKPLPEEEYDAVAFVTAEIHVLQRSKEGSVLHNDSLLSGPRLLP